MFSHYDAMGGDPAVDPNVVKAIYSDGLNKVVVVANPADKPAERAAAATAINALYGSLPIRQYGVAFLTNYKIIFNAFYTFKEAFRTAGASPTLAQYRSALSAELVIIYSLPSGFTNEFDAEKTALSLAALGSAPNYAAAWTLVQCQAWHQYINGWLGQAMAAIAIAQIARDLD